MTDQSVHVELGTRSYDVRIGAGLIDEAGQTIRTLADPPAAVAILTDENVAAAQLPRLQAALEAANVTVRTVVTIPPGEASKSFTQYQSVMEAMLASGLERRDAVIALGGGVVGDLAGFVAATLRRGVPLIQVATSLLAQVDSSVGGKTAINSAQGKNLVGAFHQPALVLCDISALDSLPQREVRAGYAEVVKYGLLGDKPFFHWLDDQRAALQARQAAEITRAVRRSVEMKAEIVARDETEQGDRALLNLGHTFGHALEAWAGYSDRLLHGEAVAIGMCLAFRLSEDLGLATPQSAARVSGHLKSFGLPVAISDIPGDDQPSRDALLRLMQQDKKVVGGEMALILVRDIGDAFVTRDVSVDKIAAFLDRAVASEA